MAENGASESLPPILREPGQTSYEMLALLPEGRGAAPGQHRRRAGLRLGPVAGRLQGPVAAPPPAVLTAAGVTAATTAGCRGCGAQFDPNERLLRDIFEAPGAALTTPPDEETTRG